MFERSARDTPTNFSLFNFTFPTFITLREGNLVHRISSYNHTETRSLVIWLEVHILHVQNNYLKSFRTYSPLDIECKLNVHQMYRRLPGRLLNVLCTFNLRCIRAIDVLCLGVISIQSSIMQQILQHNRKQTWNIGTKWTLYKKWSFPLRISSVNMIKWFLRIWSHLLKKCLIENFIFVQWDWHISIQWIEVWFNPNKARFLKIAFSGWIKSLQISRRINPISA